MRTAQSNTSPLTRPVTCTQRGYATQKEVHFANLDQRSKEERNWICWEPMRGFFFLSAANWLREPTQWRRSTPRTAEAPLSNDTSVVCQPGASSRKFFCFFFLLCFNLQENHDKLDFEKSLEVRGLFLEIGPIHRRRVIAEVTSLAGSSHWKKDCHTLCRGWVGVGGKSDYFHHYIWTKSWNKEAGYQNERELASLGLMTSPSWNEQEAVTWGGGLTCYEINAECECSLSPCSSRGHDIEEAQKFHPDHTVGNLNDHSSCPHGSPQNVFYCKGGGVFHT